jgi:hypothetical protein
MCNQYLYNTARKHFKYSFEAVDRLAICLPRRVDQTKGEKGLEQTPIVCGYEDGTAESR